METFVWFDEEGGGDGFAMPIDTEEQIEAARVEMRERGITELKVIAGAPDSPGSYENGQKLFATDEWGPHGRFHR